MSRTTRLRQLSKSKKILRVNSVTPKGQFIPKESIEDNDKMGDGKRSRGLDTVDSDKERGRVAGEIRNENVAADTCSFTEE